LSIEGVHYIVATSNLEQATNHTLRSNDQLHIDQFIIEHSADKLYRIATDLRVERNPGKAFFYSSIIPGAGQYYNGEVNKGTAFFSSHILGIGFFVAGALSETGTTGSDALIVSGAVITLASRIWSMIDAGYSANRINQSRRQ
jgi:uncharacterized protein DUF5683